METKQKEVRDLVYFEEWRSKWWSIVRRLESEKEKIDRKEKRWLWLNLLAEKCRSYAITLDVQRTYFYYYKKEDSAPLKLRHKRDNNLSVRRRFPDHVKE